MMHFCSGCIRPKVNSVCEHCGWTDTSSNFPDELPVVSCIGDRYIIGSHILRFPEDRLSDEQKFTPARHYLSYSKIYYAWDKVCHRRVEIEEFYPNGIERARERKTVLSGTDYWNQESIFYESIPLFMKMGNSPSRWCGIKGIEKILDFFEANGTWFIVREAEDAMRLEKWLKNAEAPFTFSESFNILLQLMDILTELKKMNLLHGGICDYNVFIRKDGSVLLRDFENLSFALDKVNNWIFYDEGPVEVYYSPYYPPYTPGDSGSMYSYNQYRDIYAMCCIFYSCLTGKTSRFYDASFSDVDELSNRQKMALNKGLWRGSKIWYYDIEQFREDFFNGTNEFIELGPIEPPQLHEVITIEM